MSELPDFDKMKKMTMMKLGELSSFDEEQRIQIMEMVKDGSLSIEEAHAEVKRTRPKAFKGKYLGTVPGLAPKEFTPEACKDCLTAAAALIKRGKRPAVKATMTASTVSIRFSVDDDTLETETMSRVVYAGAVPGQAKVLGIVVLHSKLGLVYSHLFQFAKAREVEDVTEEIVDRRAAAAEASLFGEAATAARLSTVTPPAAAASTAAAVANGDGGAAEDEEEVDDDASPMAVFMLHYLGSSPAPTKTGEGSVQAAMHHLREQLRVRHGLKPGKEIGFDEATPVAFVISGEGVRTVERGTKEIIHNVIMKAVSFQNTVSNKKVEFYSFIEVDDRRSTFDCHVFLCEKGVKKQGQEVFEAMTAAFAEARKRQGNPFRGQGQASTEPLEGPLGTRQLLRKNLHAVKAIGAGQFGKVYLAEYDTRDDEPADGDDKPKFSASKMRAVKMLRSGASPDDKVEFLREAQTMVELGNHDNLVEFMGIVVRRRPWLVVLEFCQFGDLSDVLRACRQKSVHLTVAERLHFARQLAAGMQFISSKGFVHMDLAARNVLLHRGNLIKVADFGLTHRFDAGKNYYKQRGVLKLSIRWLAIDSFDHKIFSEKSDVWSFAVTGAWRTTGTGKVARGRGCETEREVVACCPHMYVVENREMVAVGRARLVHGSIDQREQGE